MSIVTGFRWTTGTGNFVWPLSHTPACFVMASFNILSVIICNSIRSMARFVTVTVRNTITFRGNTPLKPTMTLSSRSRKLRAKPARISTSCGIAGMAEKELLEFIDKLFYLSNIEFIDTVVLGSYVKMVKNISPYLKDMLYLAAAVFKGCTIWSNDGPLKKQQNTIKVMTTRDLIEVLEKL